MFIIMPVHTGDAEQARRTLDLSTELKFQLNHPLVIVYPYSATPVIGPVMDAAKKAFKTVIEYRIPAEVPDGWPKGPNHMFYNIVSYLTGETPIDRELGVQQMKFMEQYGRFLLWEPDALPMHPTWLDRLETAYNVSGKPFMGAMVETWSYLFPTMLHPHNPSLRIPDKTQEPLRRDQDGVHMSGVGIYPRAMNYSAILPGGERINPFVEWFKNILDSEEGWDVLFQNEICKRNDSGDYLYFQNTSLISHNYKSSNYKIDRQPDGTYVTSDYHTRFPNGRNKFLWSHDGSIGCVLAHGCKDGSLEDVVRDLNNLKQTFAAIHTEPQAVVYSEPVPILVNEKTDSPTGLTAEQEAMLEKLMALKNKSKPASKKKPIQKGKRIPREPDVSHVDKDKFYTALDTMEWRDCLAHCKVSPGQAGVLKRMREAS